MGCDIHTLVQVKHNNEWVTVGVNVADDRSYLTFGALAGIRDRTVKPIAEPRGLPEDLNSFYKDSGMLGEHSFSWLTVDEINSYIYDVINDYDNQLTTNLEVLIETIADCLPWDANVPMENVRFVFGFDS